MFGSTLLVAVMGLSLGLDDVQKKDDQEKARTLTLLQGDWKVTLLMVSAKALGKATPTGLVLIVLERKKG